MLAAGTQAAGLLIPYLTGKVIDAAQAGDPRSQIYTYSLLIIASGVVKGVMMLFRRWLAGRLSLAVEYDLRNRMYGHMQRLSYRFFDRHQTGQLLSRATVDVQAVRVFLGYGLIFFSQHVFTVVSVLVVLTLMSVQLTLIALAITPVLALMAYRYSRVSHPVLKEVQQRVADVTTRAEENVVGVRVVKAFAQEQNESDRFRASSERIFRQALRAARLQAAYVPAMSALPSVAIAGVLLVGGYQVVHGQLDAGPVLRRQRLPGAAGAAAARDRHVGRPVPARDGVRRAGVRGAGRGARHRRAAGRPPACRTVPACCVSSMSVSATTVSGRCCRTSTSRSPPGRRSR